MNAAIFQTRDDITHYRQCLAQGYQKTPYKGPTKKLWILLPGTSGTRKLKVLKKSFIQCPNCSSVDATTTVCYELDDDYIAYRCDRIDRWIYQTSS